MVRNGQIPVQTQAPRHNEGGINNGEGGNGDPNQVEDTQERLGDEMETESLRINLQQEECPLEYGLTNPYIASCIS